MKDTVRPHEKLPSHPMRDLDWKMIPWWVWKTVCLFLCALYFLPPSLTSSPITGEFLGEFKLTASWWLEAWGQGISEMRSMSVLLPTAATGEWKNKINKYFKTFFIRRKYYSESWRRKRKMFYIVSLKGFQQCQWEKNFLSSKEYE